MSQDPGALKESIRLYYGEFGRDVAALIATELVEKGGFELLLPKLGLIDPLDNSARYHALHNFLKTKGPDALLRKISGLGEDFKIQSADTRDVTQENDRRLTEMALRDARVKRERAAASNVPAGIDPIRPPQKGALSAHPGSYPTPMNPVFANPAVQPGAANTPMQPGAANTPAQPGSVATPMQPGGAATPAFPGAAQTPAQASVKVALQSVLPTPGMAPAAPGAPQQWPVLYSGPLRPGTPPTTGTFTNTPAWDSAKPYDPNGTWPEVERRNGIERRVSPDRRGDVELIFKNRRFGKDRRSKLERRKNWPTKGYIKPDGSKP